MIDKIKGDRHGFAAVRPILRSLIQKAVRRGKTDLIEEVLLAIVKNGDLGWLKTRTPVIVFEECWTQTSLLAKGSAELDVLCKVAETIKNKDAAGLGTLAFAASEGDASVFSFASDRLAIKIVAAALKRPSDFFNWALRECVSDRNILIINEAQYYLNKAFFPWDKAFVLASAYLSVFDDLGDLSNRSTSVVSQCPYWVAIDRHTLGGKRALHRVAHSMQLSVELLGWVSFYLEGAKTNDLVDCQWWEAEKCWRFAKFGIDASVANQIWTEAATQVERAVQNEVDIVAEMLSGNRSLIS